MSNQSGSGGDSVVLHYWGTRGSIPSPGPETVVFGGNTPCVEVRAGGKRWIFDGGTGLRNLGASLSGQGEPLEATILLTHYHWDHIQGLPFFSPLYRNGTKLTVLGPRDGDYGTSQMMRQLMGPKNFPVECDHVQAQLQTGDLAEGGLEVSGAEIGVFPMRHSSLTFGFRLQVAGRVICYMPDNELVGGNHAADSRWRPKLEAFVGDADLLIHDAMFVKQEYDLVEGWGHSTVGHAIDLAESAGVKRLVLFHHAPDRADSAIIDIVSQARQRLALGGGQLKVWAARESETDVL